MDQAIRIVNTLAEDLLACNVEHVVRVFSQASQTPAKAKALRGLVFLGFPSVESDPRPNWQIPEVRQFIRKLDGEMPHFPYFLTGNPPFGFLRPYIYCLLDVQDDNTLRPQTIEPLVRRLERDIRGFCDLIADNPEPVIEKIMLSLPTQIVRTVPELRRAALIPLLPILEAIVNSPDSSDALKRTAFREAEELMGTTVDSVGSEKLFIEQVRAETLKRD